MRSEHNNGRRGEDGSGSLLEAECTEARERSARAERESKASCQVRVHDELAALAQAHSSGGIMGRCSFLRMASRLDLLTETGQPSRAHIGRCRWPREIIFAVRVDVRRLAHIDDCLWRLLP